MFVMLTPLNGVFSLGNTMLILLKAQNNIQVRPLASVVKIMDDDFIRLKETQNERVYQSYHVSQFLRRNENVEQKNIKFIEHLNDEMHCFLEFLQPSKEERILRKFMVEKIKETILSDLQKMRRPLEEGTTDHPIAKTKGAQNEINNSVKDSIHGYPIKNAIFAGDLVSVGSEESIIRIYEETPAVRQLILGEFELKNIPIAMPSELSLTNETRQVESVSLNEHMLQNVLCFSEKKKIYGQFFSNSALAANHEIILCANKSANLKFSGIFVISVYKSVQYLAVHDLSVEKIEISPNGKFVVAVSRDRCISFYTVENKFIQSVADHALIDDKMQDGKKYIHLREKKKVHTRAITTLCINNDSSRFATASKDRTVKIHDVDTLDCIESIELDNEATSLRFLDNLLIVGQCDGNLSVYTDKLQKIFQKRIHSQKITEIRCAPGKIVTVADDWLIRVFKISDPNMHVSTSMRPIELN